MKILAVSDLHYPDNPLEWLEPAVLRHRPDLIVIAGDLLHMFDAQRFQEALEFLAKFDQRKLIVIGNHDLWHERRSTAELYDELKNRDMSSYGVHVLDSDPITIGSTGFVGSLGWYDYSLFAHHPDFDSVHFYSCEGFREWEDLTQDDFGRLLVPENRKPWSALSPLDFERKVILLEDGDCRQSAHWYDRIYIRWGVTDAALTARMNSVLEVHLRSLHDRVDRIIAVTHHVPFKETIGECNDPVQAYTSAFMGSFLLGRTILRYPKVEAVLYGHTHNPKAFVVGHVACWGLHARPQLIVSDDRGHCG